MKEYLTLGMPAEDRFTEKKSVFIGNAARVETEDEAIAFVKKIKAKYPDAKHNVYAYILRENNLSRFTDDGEPHGTAGMPVLNVLRGRNLVDCAVVVTRYFGGILLGAGGLVRAYSEGARIALEAAGIVTYEQFTEVSMSLSYPDHGKIQNELTKFPFITDSTDFTDKITIKGAILSSETAALSSLVSECTSGRSRVEILGTRYDSLA